MPLGVFVTGILMGFLVAVPVGPIGLLCIHRALAQGPRAGLFSGLGVAAADASAAAIALLGLTLLSDSLISQQAWLRPLGGLFLCYLGVRTFLAGPPARVDACGEESVLRAGVSTFFLTLSNPVTLSSFMAIFAAFAIGGHGDSLAAPMLIAGVFMGSALWWILLALGLRMAGARLSSGGLWWVSRISGAAITVFGVVILLHVWQKGF